MSDDSEDKQHAATGKRLDEMRRRGSVMRSKDLSGALIILATIIVIVLTGSEIQRVFQYNFQASFYNIKTVISEPSNFHHFIKEIALNNFKLLLPVFITILVITFLAPFLFGGWNFSLEVLSFKWSKLNPIENLKRIFSFKQSLSEIVKSVVKATLLLGVLIFYFILNKSAIVNLSQLNGNLFIYKGLATISQYVFILCIALIVIVILDMAYNYFQFKEKSKMSTQEVKDEAKDMDGNVQTKRKIRSMQISLLKQRLHQTVPKANVIITNPTHYAVALRYDENKDSAPKVVAKGQGLIATQIRRIATANGIIIYEAPALARSIYYTSKINAEIHPGLYMAVAIVLSYVYQLKNYQMGVIEQPPSYVEDFKIPEELYYPQ